MEASSSESPRKALGGSSSEFMRALSDDIHDPLRHHDHLFDRSAGQCARHRFKTQRSGFDLVLGGRAGDRKFIPSLAIYLYGNGNPISSTSKAASGAGHG